MGQRKLSSSNGGDAHGYLTTAAVFAGMTALWAVIVRNDPYYRITDLFGARVPATMIAYLMLMPLAGFLIGRWRYHAPHRGGAAGYALKLGARFIHFTYVHLLIVLFTVAMATEYFLGLNIDEQVRRLDDRMFEIAARFAPWLAAYLAGFNLGRALRREPALAGEDIPFEGVERFEDASAPASRERSEPVFEAAEKAEPAAPARTHSGLAPALAEGLDEAPGFLPPQDFDQLRPKLSQLR